MGFAAPLHRRDLQRVLRRDQVMVSQGDKETKAKYWHRIFVTRSKRNVVEMSEQ
jgi:hypothetical protein